MNEHMRILIAYDGSSYADAALDDLRWAGLPREAEALLLTVVDVGLRLPTREESDASPAARLDIILADEWPADLIVVGAQGRSALSRLMLGSVSQKVVTSAACSVRIARGRPGRTDASL